MSEVRVVADAKQLAISGAELIIKRARIAVSANGRFSIALSGGSTPKALYELLGQSPYKERVDWSKVLVFWGDERCVPPDNSESCYRMARETLLDHVPIPANQIYRIRGEADPPVAASEYEQTLRGLFTGDFPRLDLILLGMGDDGHTASLFPGSEALKEQQRWVVPNYAQSKNMWRITFSAPAINAAANIVFLVSGSGKAERLRDVLIGTGQAHQFPAQLINPTNGKLLWLVDKAAAALWQQK